MIHRCDRPGPVARCDRGGRRAATTSTERAGLRREPPACPPMGSRTYRSALLGGNVLGNVFSLEVFRDLGVPVLVGAGGVDLDFEALHHFRSDIGRVYVKLLIPAAQLIDSAVLLD